jgi:penicillin-binding protein-related factor A (putative recombinase)
VATPEKKVKQKVCAKLKELGAYYFYASTGGYGASGVPDIVACYKGKFIGIECKANGNKATALQQKHLREISMQQGISLIIDETNIEMLEYYVKGKRVMSLESKT